MGFGEAVRACFRRYGVFRGRARRSEFWWFQAFALLAWLPTAAAFAALWTGAFDGAPGGPAADPAINPEAVGWGALTGAFGALTAYLVVVGVPAVAVGARRLHDGGRSAAWLLLIPVGLGLVPLVMAAIPGDRGSNRHGPDPRA